MAPLSRSNLKSDRAQRGFTLAEVLVALAVLAVSLAAVLGVVGQSARTAVDLRDRTEAMWLAQDRLTEHQLKRDWPDADTTTGDSETNGRKWYWREQVTTTPNTEMRRIEIEVRAVEGREVLARLAGYLRRP
jgi:general secretion pathway protein I